MASTNSRVTGQPYPVYLLQFAAGTTAVPGEYGFVLTIVPEAPVGDAPEGGSRSLTDDSQAVLESVLEGIAGWLATQPNVTSATGSPELIRVTEANAVLYLHP